MAATEMCLVHNMLIRMLNCIYLQAPNVKLEKDISDFAIFMHAFLVTIHEHHGNEEKFYFPGWRTERGGQSLYGQEHRTHHGFAPGIQAFEDYVSALREERQSTMQEKFVRSSTRSDCFGRALKEEITTFEPSRK